MKWKLPYEERIKRKATPKQIAHLKKLVKSYRYIADIGQEDCYNFTDENYAKMSMQEAFEHVHYINKDIGLYAGDEDQWHKERGNV